MGFLKQNPKEAKRRGISQRVAEEFAKLPKGKKLKQLPQKKKIKKCLSNVLENINKALTSQTINQGKEFLPIITGGRKNKRLLSRMLQVMNQRNEQALREVESL